MGRLLRIAVLAATLGVVAFVVPLAGANGPMGGTENVTMDMPADGTGTATRTPMPASSTTGTVGVTASNDYLANSLTTFLLAQKPTRGARVVSCVLLTRTLLDGEDDDGEEDANVSDPSLQLLFLKVCIQMALQLSQSGQSPRALGRLAAGGKCGIARKAVHVKITKTASGYQAVMSGMSYTPKSSALRISCTPTAHGLKATMRPKSRARKLAQVIGPKIGVGFWNRSSSAGKLKISLGVN
jgi:hypothetical protein